MLHRPHLHSNTHTHTRTHTPLWKRTFLIFIAEVLRCQERAAMIINWLSAICWGTQMSHPSWWRTQDGVSGSDTYRRGRWQLWKISVGVTFPRTTTRYSIRQGGKTRRDEGGREEAFLPWQRRQPKRELEMRKWECWGEKRCNSEVTGC